MMLVKIILNILSLASHIWEINLRMNSKSEGDILFTGCPLVHIINACLLGTFPYQAGHIVHIAAAIAIKDTVNKVMATDLICT
jgi:hypothetical protein